MAKYLRYRVVRKNPTTVVSEWYQHALRELPDAHLYVVEGLRTRGIFRKREVWEEISVHYTLRLADEAVKILLGTDSLTIRRREAEKIAPLVLMEYNTNLDPENICTNTLRR